MPQGQNNNKIAISGATGFIGSALNSFFAKNNFTVVKINRSDFSHSPKKLANKIKGCNIIVNLAGAPVNHKWTDSYKNEILASRINTTRKLVRAIGILEQKPELFISASAVGIYDSFEVHDEFSTNYDNNFLGSVCRKWEAEAFKSRSFSNVRLCIIRLGVVLGKEGGAFPKIVKPFRYGFGAKLGDGHQLFPYIHINDVLSAIWYLIKNEEASGIYNLVAPQMISNLEFTAALQQKLKKSLLPSIPESLIRFMYGEGAETILTGQKVIPKRLQNNGFIFEYPDITSVISNLIKK